jgi:hypothetical protein
MAHLKVGSRVHMMVGLKVDLWVRSTADLMVGLLVRLTAGLKANRSVPSMAGPTALLKVYHWVRQKAVLLVDLRAF